ncbi:solute carrier family 46 member 3-like [Megalops cyprinoides]|uniref:solute carrier family 46 member 3-like n=1 Tax=Megalops cyprinoides TaxID=118141 RepID=UPI001864EFE1|nr:solute carrier family 46 member 3-like [Megalops cyprinoides]
MKGFYLVEPVVAIYSFATFLVYPLMQQYVYRRLWEELTNTSYPVADISGCAANSSNLSRQYEEVEKAASLFSLYNELFSVVPGLIVTVILLAYSDHRGRRISIILPLVGSLVYTVSVLAISFFELNINLLIVTSFISALFGSWGTLLGGCFSYVADVCHDGKQKTLRMAGLDMVIGVLSGAASVCSGYFLKATGFNWPFFASSLLHGANLLYVIFVLEETVKVSASEGAQEGRSRVPLRKLASRVYQLFATADRRRSVLLVLLLLTFTIYCFCNVGSMSVVTLFELNEPLCWSEILIGYGSAFSTINFLTSFLGVSILSRCLPNLPIVIIGLLSMTAGLIMTAFAKTTQLMFLVNVPMILAIMPAPVLRSMMSKIVSKSEQGALFGCVAFLESLSSSIAFIAFSSLYAATVAWFPGLCFLVAAGLCMIPMALMGVVGFLDSKEVAEPTSLISGEEMEG